MAHVRRAGTGRGVLARWEGHSLIIELQQASSLSCVAKKAKTLQSYPSRSRCAVALAARFAAMPKENHEKKKKKKNLKNKPKKKGGRRADV